MLLCLIKHSRPDIENTTRKLSKCLTKATKMEHNELLRIMSFVKTNKNLGLKMNVNGAYCNFINPSSQESKTIPWYLRAYCDAEFASNTDKRLSFTGFLMQFCGALMSWKSKL